MVASVLLAGSLATLWATLFAGDGGDLAAQYAWTRFVGSHPGSPYDLSWYGGMHAVSYSVLTPYLMAWFGVRATAVVAGVLSAAILARLMIRSGMGRPLLPSLCGAAGLSCDIASGRVTFSIGILFALAATLVVVETRRTPWGGAAGGGALAVLATMASPVDGLFLLVVAPAVWLTGRRGAAVALAGGPVLVVGSTTLLFPFYGVQPYPPSEALLVLFTVLPLALLAPRTWRAVRAAGWVYLTGTLLTLLIPSPVGSNVERLALLFATALLVAAARATRGRRAQALWLAFTVALCWQSVIPVQDLRTAAPAVRWTGFTVPLRTELSRLGANRARVEVVPTDTHVESSTLAPYLELARGWNRQLDTTRNPLFYRGVLTAAGYHVWLRQWEVGYVVLPATGLDYAAVAEGHIVAAGQPWLRQVWSDPHWTVYRVTDAVPLVSAPATVLSAGQSEVRVLLPSAGSVLVHVLWSPWLTVLGSSGSGCLEQAGVWTRLRAATAGTFRIGSSYSPARAVLCPLPGT